jgi:hypothetical protein
LRRAAAHILDDPRVARPQGFFGLPNELQGTEEVAVSRVLGIRRCVDLAEKLLVDRLHRTARHAHPEQADIAHVEIAIASCDADNHPFGIKVVRSDDAKFLPSIAPTRLDRTAEQRPV